MSGDASLEPPLQSFSLSRRLTAELLGTALLLAVVVGSGIMGQRLSGGNDAIALLANTLATGAGLVVLITVFGPISGAHFNPAVTLVFVLRRELSVRFACSYLVVQVVGAVLGVFAALVGSVVVTLAGWVVWRLNAAEFVVVVWAGFLGSLFDSVLGASVQALYRDPLTGQSTEQPRTADRPHTLLRGFRWINNDVVNFLASAVGVLCAWLLLRFGLYPYR